MPLPLTRETSRFYYRVLLFTLFFSVYILERRALTPSITNSLGNQNVVFTCWFFLKSERLSNVIMTVFHCALHVVPHWDVFVCGHAQQAVSYLLPAVSMVCLYSYLPHKARDGSTAFLYVFGCWSNYTLPHNPMSFLCYRCNCVCWTFHSFNSHANP